MSTVSPLPGIADYNALWDYYNELYLEKSAFSDVINQITMAFQYNGSSDLQNVANAIRSVASAIRKDGSWKGEAADSCCSVLDQLADRADKEYEQYCNWVKQAMWYYTETMRQQEKELELIRQQFNADDEETYQNNLKNERYTLGNVAEVET